MSRLPFSRTVRSLTVVTCLALLAGCMEHFQPSAPALGGGDGAATLVVTHWADTLVLGARHPVEAQVVDAQGQPVPDAVVTWTIGSPGVLGAAAGTADTVDLDALALGTSQMVFSVEGHPELTATRQVKVLVAGVLASTAHDTTLTAWPDTAVVVASALGYPSGGPTLGPFANQGVTWTRTGPGAVTLLESTGDTVRVVASWIGTDTLIATHSQCLAEAACADTVLVTVNDPMLPGGDVLVLADQDPLMTVSTGSSPSHQALFGNIVGFTNSRPRSTGQTVMFYTGAGSYCSTECATANGFFVDALGNELTAEGYTVVNETGSLATIPADIKVVFLFMPTATIPAADVNGLKQFARDGGRVVITADANVATSLPAVNEILSDLGVQVTNQDPGPACNTGTETSSAEGTHQLVTGVSLVTMVCHSTFTPGPTTVTLLRDPSNQVTGAVERIDFTPLP